MIQIIAQAEEQFKKINANPELSTRASQSSEGELTFLMEHLNWLMDHLPDQLNGDGDVVLEPKSARNHLMKYQRQVVDSIPFMFKSHELELQHRS